MKINELRNLDFTNKYKIINIIELNILLINKIIYITYYFFLCDLDFLTEI